MNEANQPPALTWPMERIQERLGRPLRDELVERYVTRGETLAQIGDALGVGPTTVHRWMRRLDIEARFPGQRGTAA